MKHLLVGGLLMALAACVDSRPDPHVSGDHVAHSITRYLVRRGDVEIEVLREGSGPLIVLLPSTGRGADDLGELASLLASGGFTVLRPQPRGIGGSKGPMTDVTFSDFGDDIAGVIANAGGEPAVLVGHAYGNWIARVVASEHPGLVRGIVLLAAGAKNFPRELSDAITTINHPATPEGERLRALELAFFAPRHDARGWLTGWHPEVMASQRAARANSDQQSWWAGGNTPMLDLIASDDPFRPAATREEYRREFGDRVTTEIIADASHALPAEQPAQVARSIVAWISRL